jgi:uncharacterized protein (DUF362 family)
MERRDFLKKAIGTSLLAGVGLKLANASSLISSTAFSGLTATGNAYDLVAIMGGEPDAMFDKGIAELGGMQKFVKPGQTVVVKPNIGWDKPVENGANTNPALVKRIVQHCLNAGAKEVFVFDNTCDKWTNCYKNSGIEAAVNEAGGKIVPGDNEKYYREVAIPNGKSLKKTKIHEKILDSDVFINVPVLKSHGGGKLTICMKNLMGIVWDRYWWHGHDLHQCIADCATIAKPHLNVVDAYRVMMENGPRGNSPADCVLKKSLVMSTDMVAADAAAAKIFGIEPSEVRYIGLAYDLKVGNQNLDTLNIKRIKL